MRTLTLIRKTVSPADPPVTLRVVAHTHLVKLLEAEGAEAVMPDLMDFLQYCL